jgi:hypothetical protein
VMAPLGLGIFCGVATVTSRRPLLVGLGMRE